MGRSVKAAPGPMPSLPHSIAVAYDRRTQPRGTFVPRTVTCASDWLEGDWRWLDERPYTQVRTGSPATDWSGVEWGRPGLESLGRRWIGRSPPGAGVGDERGSGPPRSADVHVRRRVRAASAGLGQQSSRAPRALTSRRRAGPAVSQYGAGTQADAPVKRRSGRQSYLFGGHPPLLGDSLAFTCCTCGGTGECHPCLRAEPGMRRQPTLPMRCVSLSSLLFLSRREFSPGRPQGTCRLESGARLSTHDCFLPAGSARAEGPCLESYKSWWRAFRQRPAVLRWPIGAHDRAR
jgi:hypothetical protein